SSKVAGLNSDLLNGIHAGLALRRNARGACVRSVLAFHPERLSIRRSAVETNEAVGSPRGTRNHLHHGVGVPNACASGQRAPYSKKRKFIEPACRDVVADIAAFGSQQRSVGVNRNFIGCGSYFE